MTNFLEAIDVATQAANAAGVNWVSERIAGKDMVLVVTEDRAFIVDNAGNRLNPMFDLCGGASIQLRGKRSAIYKWLKKTQPDRQHYSLSINTKFGGWQDMDLKVTMIRAAFKVLSEQYGIDGISYTTYID